MKKENEFKLNIKIPNGIILTVIGVLLLITPLFHSMIRSDALIDAGAGLLLISGGLMSLYSGVRNLKK